MSGFDGDDIRKRFAESLERAKRNMPTRTLIAKTQEAQLFLIDCDYFFPGPKAQFAVQMDWWMGDPAALKPDRKLVEDVCNLTRDQDLWPEVAQQLGGLVIAYSPSQGGMVLVNEEGETPLDHLVHILVGDLQHQRRVVTIHRRRQPTWKKAGSSAANTGDMEMARLLWQAEAEIKQAGFVALATEQKIQQVVRARGWLE